MREARTQSELHSRGKKGQRVFFFFCAELASGQVLGDIRGKSEAICVCQLTSSKGSKRVTLYDRK